MKSKEGKQGDPISPKLFNWALKDALKKIDRD